MAELMNLGGKIIELEVMFEVVNFMGQILSFPAYNGSPVVQAPNYSSFYMGLVDSNEN
jgi:hypothetical protein